MDRECKEKRMKALLAMVVEFKVWAAFVVAFKLQRGFENVVKFGGQGH